MAQKRVANDLDEAVATVAQVARELNDDTACGGIAAGTRDEGLEALRYEKAKIDLVLGSPRRLGLHDESLKKIRLVAVVAELQGLGRGERVGG